VDPHAVLGLKPGASSQDVQRAYRALAKRFHPDRAGGEAGEMMISINAAYDLLREQLEGDVATRAKAPAPAPAPAAPRAPGRRRAGDWLTPAVRRVLARELLVALEDGETVDDVVLTATSDSHDVQLAVTDRRLLWLRDDAIVGRVRSLRFRELASVQARRGGLLRRAAELRARGVDGRRVRFFELRPELAERLASTISAHAVRRLV